MNILNMIPHVRNTFEGTSPSVVCIPLVPDAEDALGLAQNEGNLVELGEGIGVRSGRGLFLSVHDLFRHFFRSARVTSAAHVCEGPGKPIFGDLAVQVAILHIKSDTLIIVGPVKDSGVQFVSHYLVTYGI
jgi:hypothetical protein